MKDKRFAVLIPLLLAGCADTIKADPPVRTHTTTTVTTTATTTTNQTTSTTSSTDSVSSTDAMDALATARCAAQDACTDAVFVVTGACEVCASAARSTEGEVERAILNDCIAEVDALAAVDPCGAAVLHPPPAACDDLFNALGTVAPEGHYIMAFRNLWSSAALACDPDFTWDVDEDCYSGCEYKPLAARTCLDLAPWSCGGGAFPLNLPPACAEAYDCGGPGTVPGGTTVTSP